MLDAFIIEELKRRESEEERLRDLERPRLEIPIPVAPEEPMLPPGAGDDRKPDRGVLIIDFSV